MALSSPADARSVSGGTHRAIVNALGDAILLYPLSPEGPGPVLFANRAALDLYGYTADEMATRTIDDLIAPGQGSVEAAFGELRRTRRTTFEATHLAQDGHRIHVATSARLVEVDGRLCVVAACRDDTDRQQFRRQLARENLDLERAVAARTGELEAFADDLKILHEITTATHVSASDRLDAYLQAGCRIFDLPVGILSSVPIDAETGEQLYRIEAVVSPSPDIRAGLTIPLRHAFCDAVVASRGTVVYTDAEQDPVGATNPACTERGFRSFIGTPVYVDGDLFGTINFVSSEPRDHPFAPYERDLVEVMAQAIGRQLGLDRANAERDRAEGWYRSVVNTLQEALVLVDRDGRVLQANPAAGELLGVGAGANLRESRGTVIGEGGVPVPEEDLPERTAFVTGQPVRNHTQGVARPDGTTRWYCVNATPVDEARDGHVDYVVLSFNDITGLRDRTEAALRSEALLQVVQNASPEGIMAFHAVHDEAGAIVDFEWTLANPAAASIVGLPAGDLVGHRLLEVFPGNREAGLFDAYVRVVETGRSYRTELEYPHDGLDTTYRVQAAPLDVDADGTFDGFVVTFTDLGLFEGAPSTVASDGTAA